MLDKKSLKMLSIFTTSSHIWFLVSVSGTSCCWKSKSCWTAKVSRRRRWQWEACMRNVTRGARTWSSCPRCCNGRVFLEGRLGRCRMSWRSSLAFNPDPHLHLVLPGCWAAVQENQPQQAKRTDLKSDVKIEKQSCYRGLLSTRTQKGLGLCSMSLISFHVLLSCKESGFFKVLFPESLQNEKIYTPWISMQWKC